MGQKLVSCADAKIRGHEKIKTPAVRKPHGTSFNGQRVCEQHRDADGSTSARKRKWDKPRIPV